MLDVLEIPVSSCLTSFWEELSYIHYGEKENLMRCVLALMSVLTDFKHHNKV